MSASTGHCRAFFVRRPAAAPISAPSMEQFQCKEHANCINRRQKNASEKTAPEALGAPGDCEGRRRSKPKRRPLPFPCCPLGASRGFKERWCGSGPQQAGGGTRFGRPWQNLETPVKTADMRQSSCSQKVVSRTSGRSHLSEFHPPFRQTCWMAPIGGYRIRHCFGMIAPSKGIRCRHRESDLLRTPSGLWETKHIAASDNRRQNRHKPGI